MSVYRTIAIAALLEMNDIKQPKMATGNINNNTPTQAKNLSLR